MTWDTELYHCYCQPLVHQAMRLVHDRATAEDVVQDCFIRLHRARLHDNTKALAYLRRSVTNGSLDVLRHRKIAERCRLLPPDMPSAEYGALAGLEQSAVVSALHVLSARQREALVLRYYADLSEAQIASAMGISRGAVKAYIARGKSALRKLLEC